MLKRNVCAAAAKESYQDIWLSRNVDAQVLIDPDVSVGFVLFCFLSHAGPCHMSLYLMPHRGASLSTWSFGDGTPHFDLSGEYFIFYSHGLDVHTWTFWFEIQVYIFKL